MSATFQSTTNTLRYGLGRMAATTLLAVAAGIALPVWAQGGPGFGGGPGMGAHAMGGHGMGGHGMMAMGSPERIGRMVDHMLDGLKATDAQRTQIRQIAQSAAAEMAAQRDARRALRQKGLQILGAPTLDAAAAEALRQQTLAQHDQASKRMLQAMLDIAKVLTPEQRAKVGERMKQRGAMMHERMERLQRERPKQ